MATSVPPQPGSAPPSPWRNSRAKQQLFDDIVSRRTANMKTSTVVWKSRPIYQRYPLKNFQTNYGTMRRRIQAKVKSADMSRDAFANDFPIVRQRRQQQSRQKFFYPGSQVQQQLRRDVRAGRTDRKKPRTLFYANKIFCEQPGLSLRQFANHLHYERRLIERTILMEAYTERMQFVNAQIVPNDMTGGDSDEEE